MADNSQASVLIHHKVTGGNQTPQDQIPLTVITDLTYHQRVPDFLPMGTCLYASLLLLLSCEMALLRVLRVSSEPSLSRHHSRTTHNSENMEE